MFLRRPEWAQLIRNGVPPLFVLRPLAGGFTPLNVGDLYPAPDPNDKFQLMRARQMYQQRRVGTGPELEVTMAKSGRQPVPAEEPKASTPAKQKREKSHGRS
ncbi:MAG TPA: hypothetical protein VE999_06665 [Gemmataceae bacterium]|nr:hypothetical protein [Bryobacteraceae bacterium]HZV04748.1 hypothetical protein [Gemmataceae bacterium]